LEHLYNESFFVRSNLDAPNFKILKSSSFEDNEIPNLQTIVSHDESIFISDILYSNNNLVMEVRENGLPELSILNLKTNKLNYIDFDDNAYDVSLSFNNEIDGKSFNYYYSSLTKAPRIITYDLIDNTEDIVWSKQVLSFDENDYLDNRFFINSRDGTQVPVVTIAHKSTDLTSAPILFYGYGSYGINIDASFRSSLIPLLDRGFIFSIINIRGGGEMGKHWYENGRMNNKLNTFYDFNDGVKAVVKKGIGDPNNVFARGGSAGGLLMGTIINLEPHLYKGILSGVPFVDVLTTMSDPSIPLTTFEYDEWGNPANKDEYFYMKQYSPYDNIENKNYPAVFITSSLYDSQVQYFEPAKYTAKLREFNTSVLPILMKMNLIGGHGGMSGKINQFEEIAEEYNFILNLID
jgi:oligopeptidase B